MKLYSIYQLCDSILKKVIIKIKEDIIDLSQDEDENDDHKLYECLYCFLIKDDSFYNFIIYDEINKFQFDNGIELNYSYNSLKKIMILNILSVVYISNLICNSSDLEEKRDKSIKKSISALDRILVFMNANDNYDLIYYLMEKYLNFTEEDKDYQRECFDNIIKSSKLKVLINLNPFIVFEMGMDQRCDELTIMELIINDFKNFNKQFEKQAKEYLTAEEYLFSKRKTIDDFLRKQYPDDEKLKKVYGYVFSNVYEYVKTFLHTYENIQDKNYHVEIGAYLSLIEVFEKPGINLDSLYFNYFNDLDFFKQIVDIFLYNNYDSDIHFLCDRRQMLKIAGGFEFLKRFDGFVEEEEKIFKLEKNQ